MDHVAEMMLNRYHGLFTPLRSVSEIEPQRVQGVYLLRLGEGVLLLLALLLLLGRLQGIRQHFTGKEEHSWKKQTGFLN